MKNLDRALLQSQESMKGIHKDGSNEFAKFGYTSIEEVVKVCRAVLHSNGLVFFPGEQELRADQNILYIKQTYILSHPQSEETRHITRTMIVPDNTKMSPCQSQGSAESYMLKNTLRELLLLPRFDKAEEIDSHDNTKQEDKKPRQFTRY